MNTNINKVFSPHVLDSDSSLSCPILARLRVCFFELAWIGLGLACVELGRFGFVCCVVVRIHSSFLTSILDRLCCGMKAGSVVDWFGRFGYVCTVCELWLWFGFCVNQKCWFSCWKFCSWCSWVFWFFSVFDSVKRKKNCGLGFVDLGRLLPVDCTVISNWFWPLYSVRNAAYKYP